MGDTLLVVLERGPGVSRGAFARWLRRARPGVMEALRGPLKLASYSQRPTVYHSPVNALMRWMQETLPPPDAVEVMEVERAALAQQLASSEGGGLGRLVDGPLDVARCALWLARPHVLRDGRGGRRAGGEVLMWLGRGLPQLDDSTFQEHYLRHHGPLACRYAEPLGMDRYAQLHRTDDELNERLRARLGTGPSFPVAAEIIPDLAAMMSPRNLRRVREARAVVGADEKRHIDFHRSHIWMTRQRRVL